MDSAIERQGMLFVLVGPGGVGKNALLSEVLRRFDNLHQLPTATTRPPRENEQHGRQRLFLSLEEFQELIAAGALIEHQEVYPGVFYGVPRRSVDEAIANQVDLIADIEFKGARVIRDLYPHNSLTIFIAPPSIEALRVRLENRQANVVEIDNRLERMAEEMVYAPLSQYVIVNDSLEVAVDELANIIRLERQQGQQPPHVFPLNRVSFSLEVRRADGVVVTDVLLPGEHPLVAGERLAGEPVRVGDPPVEIGYDADEHVYHLLYRFVV